MKYYLIAGEPSGDLHGANLMKEIRRWDAEAEFRIWGGDKMEKEGGVQVMHIGNRSYMGIWEVVLNLSSIRKQFALCKKDLVESKADALILIDYPGFNLKIAAFAKTYGIPVHYYIAPKVWAWNTNRVHKIKRYVDHLYSILPFEERFFKQYQIEVDYIGNPLMDEIAAHQHDPETISQLKGLEKPIVALLPGSRKMELENMLPLMSEMAVDYPDYRFVVAATSGFSIAEIKTYCHPQSELLILQDKTYEILSLAKAALVTSGTATLETALWKVPQVVCYKFAKLSYMIGKRLIKVPFISLVNLVMEKKVVTELIQDGFKKRELKKELNKILDPEHQKSMKMSYKALQIKVGEAGASQKAAKLIVNRVKE
jgi:lipid-A-disaccharide synthase